MTEARQGHTEAGQEGLGGRSLTLEEYSHGFVQEVVKKYTIKFRMKNRVRVDHPSVYHQHALRGQTTLTFDLWPPQSIHFILESQ